MNTIRSERNEDNESVTVRERFHRFLERCEKYRGYTTLIMALLSVALYFAVRTFKSDDKPAQLRFTESASEQNEDLGTPGVQPSKEILSGPSYDTALRLRESGALLMAVSLTTFEEYRIHKSFPPTPNLILTSLQKRLLLPPGVEIKDGVFRSLVSEITINYRSDPFSFEILSLPSAGASGPALLFRVPIPSGEPNSITYFRFSPDTRISIPRPFSSVEQLVASGWTLAQWQGEASPLDDAVLRDLREHELWLRSLKPKQIIKHDVSRERIERFDASNGIPRKANEQYLPSYNAFWHWAADIGRGAFYVLLGLIEAGLFLFAGWLLDQPGLINLAFWAGALCCVCGGFVDAYSLLKDYRVRHMSTAHGSARWANAKDLVRCGLMNRVRGLPLPVNALPIAKAFGGRDIFLPPSQWLRHFVMFGPTGSGKSKTFFISMIRAILGQSSCLVYDPKGELFAQTAGSAKRVFRLDLNDPTKSDRWNFIPQCRNDPAFACQVAGMMIGIESRRKTNADPFWGDAEQIALTAILLHISEVYKERAIPAFAADFLISLGEDGNGAFAQAMENSPSLYAKQAYLAFRQAPIQTRGSILIGLYNKLRPFTLAPARMVTMPPTRDEVEVGCRTINFANLRKPGTAIYLVVSEGAADIYKEFIATFLGQAVMEMRLDGLNEPEHPCFVLIDEAYQLNVAEVKRISGIGRGRGVGLGLGYQDLPQMYDQYGRERANAILGTVMTKIVLPGLDDVTAEYASKQLGETTIFSKTFQDFPGKKNDNTRYAEQRRALMHASEIRQIARHSEVLIVSDTAPPIRAAYPPFAVLKSLYLAKQKGSPQELHLGDIDPAFLLTERPKAVAKPNAGQPGVADLISKEVERIYSDERLLGAVEQRTKTAVPKSSAEKAVSKRSYATKLDDLVGDVRLLLANRYEQKTRIERGAA